MSEKIYSFISLAKKAGKVLSGEFACEKAIKAEKTALIIVAEDASENTKKKFSDMCSYREIDIRYFGQKDLLGRYIGKEIRAVVAVTEQNFAIRIKEMIDGGNLHDGGGQFGKTQNI